MKDKFKKFYNNIEVSDELVDMTLNKYLHKKHFPNYKLIISLTCIILIMSGFIYYHTHINYTGDFTLVALESNEKKKAISSVYTSSKARIQVIDISKMSEEEKEQLSHQSSINNEICWSNYQVFYHNENIFVKYYQNLYFDIDIKNVEHLKMITIKKKSQNGHLDVTANDKYYSTPYSFHTTPGNADGSKTIITNEIKVSGEDYRNGYKENLPFLILWSPSHDLFENILNDSHYDFSTIKDEITVKMTYDNHKVIKKTLLISFDKDGYMSVQLKK